MNPTQPGKPSKSPAPSSLITFLKGLMSGLILGVALCAGVALYVTRLPIPFSAHVSPTPPLTERTAGEGRDSNAEHGLMGPSVDAPAPRLQAAAPDPGTGSSAPAPPSTPAPAVAALPTPDSEHPAAVAPPSVAASKSADSSPSSKPPVAHTPPAAVSAKSNPEEPASSPATWFVQTGAFGTASDAENQRARLALLGLEATVLSPEAGEKPLYRVRLGPLTSIDEVRTLVATLKSNDIPTSISRGNALKPR